MNVEATAAQRTFPEFAQIRLGLSRVVLVVPQRITPALGEGRAARIRSLLVGLPDVARGVPPGEAVLAKLLSARVRPPGRVGDDEGRFAEDRFAGPIVVVLEPNANGVLTVLVKRQLLPAEARAWAQRIENLISRWRRDTRFEMTPSAPLIWVYANAREVRTCNSASCRAPKSARFGFLFPPAQDFFHLVRVVQRERRQLACLSVIGIIRIFCFFRVEDAGVH